MVQSSDRCGSLHEVLDSWWEGEQDEDLRLAVLTKRAWISENLEEISEWAALPGQHPLRRSIELDEGVVITTPNKGAYLLEIETIEW